MNIKDIFDGLCACSKLERDRAEESLITNLKSFNDLSVINNLIDEKLVDKDLLETCLGCLTAIKTLLINFNSIPVDILLKWCKECVLYHKHNEYRVRMLAGECMGELCRLVGVTQFAEFIIHVKIGIANNLKNRKDSQQSDLLFIDKNENRLSHLTKLNTLETWIKCFQFMVNGIGISFEDISDPEAINLIFEAMDNDNRFVRESGFELIGTIADCRGYRNNKYTYMRACEQLATGLSDNWSQVRMAASVATRRLLLTSRPSTVDESDVFKLLLPRICLNRYYTAEGVKLQSQETWRTVVGNAGKLLIERHIEPTVDFYEHQAGNENPAVREAACHSISELATKIDNGVVSPFVARLFNCTLPRCSDSCCTVREAASTACGRLGVAFPAIAVVHGGGSLVPLLLGNVIDSAHTVREAAAVAMAAVVGAQQGDSENLLEKTLDFIFENLESIDQGVTDEGFCRYEEGGESPSDISTTGPKSSPWERAAGCTLLVAELTAYSPRSHEHLSRLLPAIVTATEGGDARLLATAASAVSRMIGGLDRRTLKRHVEGLLSILVAGLASDCAVTVSVAEEAVKALSGAIGAAILRGRIEMLSPALASRTERLF